MRLLHVLHLTNQFLQLQRVQLAISRPELVQFVLLHLFLQVILVEHQLFQLQRQFVVEGLQLLHSRVRIARRLVLRVGLVRLNIALGDVRHETTLVGHLLVVDAEFVDFLDFALVHLVGFEKAVRVVGVFLVVIRRRVHLAWDLIVAHGLLVVIRVRVRVQLVQMLRIQERDLLSLQSINLVLQHGRGNAGTVSVQQL